MAEQTNQNQARPANVVMSPDALKDIVATAIAEARKPYVDPQVEARKQRERQQRIDDIKMMEEAKQTRVKMCNHLREDGTSAIAWIRNSDRIVRGVCQHCNGLFTPEHEDYVRLLRIPTKGAIGEACLAGR